MSQPLDDTRLLTVEQIRLARGVGELIRAGRVAPLIGAGLSVSAGLPTWNELGERLIRSWQPEEPSARRRRLSPDNYLALIRQLFGADDLAFTSYLRHRLISPTDPAASSAAFSALVYRALYGDISSEEETGQRLRPNDTHRHIIALFDECPGQIWTTNYDDLLERAASDLGKEARSSHLTDHRARRGLIVHHLHGYLPPAPPGRAPELHPVVLAEDDYHAVAANLVDAAWIDRAFYQLFDTWQVLILGMSLTDRNLRRVLATLPPGDGTGHLAPQHYALLKMLSAKELGQQRTHQLSRSRLAMDASALRAEHWTDYGIQVIDLANHQLLLPFLMRLRYEAHGATRGQLWTDAARHVAQRIRPWEAAQQRRGLALLDTIKQELARDFRLPPAEIVDVGLFLLAESPIELELVMRVGLSVPAQRRERTFSVDPDAPSGAAGCVFVAGSGMIIRRDDIYHDYGVTPAPSDGSVLYAALIQAPVIDWLAGGLPAGVLYVTVGSPDALLLQPTARETLDWLTDAGQRLLAGLLGRAAGH